MHRLCSMVFKPTLTLAVLNNEESSENIAFNTTRNEKVFEAQPGSLVPSVKAEDLSTEPESLEEVDRIAELYHR